MLSLPPQRGPARRLLADGNDGVEERGLLVLSAFHLAASDLHGIEVRVLGGQDIVIRTAVDALSWDTGLRITLAPPDADLATELAEAALFVAVAARSTDHLPLAQLAASGVPSLVAVQFPPPGASAPARELVRAAHDPRVLAGRILAMLGLA